MIAALQRLGESTRTHQHTAGVPRACFAFDHLCLELLPVRLRANSFVRLLQEIGEK